MKHIATIFIMLLVLVFASIGIYLSTFVVTETTTEIIDENGQERRFTGLVYQNVMEIPMDGNNYLMVDIENGRVLVLYEEGGLVPADRADELCNKNPLVAQTAQSIEAGDTVEIFAVFRTDRAYAYEVCSSPDYSISVIQPAENQEDDAMQTTRQVAGTVVELISDCAFDGNCAYVVETESGELLTVIWAEGMSPICQNDPFQGGDTDIQVGDSIDSLGRVIDASTSSACGDPSYYIRKIA